MSKHLANGYEQVYKGKDKEGKEIWNYVHREKMGVGVGDKRVVHHRDSVKSNSDKSNLQVVASKMAHNKIDKKIQKGKK